MGWPWLHVVFPEVTPAMTPHSQRSTISVRFGLFSDISHPLFISVSEQITDGFIPRLLNLNCRDYR
jgi:hypothetical protein